MRTRINCTALANIHDAQGRIALFIVRTSNGTTMRPLGGSFQSAHGRSYLVRNFGASDFEYPYLRFTVPNTQVQNVTEWFREGVKRETSALRLLSERLVDKLRILTPADIGQMREGRPGFTHHLAQARHNEVTQHTIYLINVFGVTMPDAVMAKLKAAADGDRPLLHFATPTEIRELSGRGGYISSIATCLLRA